MVSWCKFTRIFDNIDRWNRTKSLKLLARNIQLSCRCEPPPDESGFFFQCGSCDCVRHGEAWTDIQVREIGVMGGVGGGGGGGRGGDGVRWRRWKSEMGKWCEGWGDVWDGGVMRAGGGGGAMGPFRNSWFNHDSTCIIFIYWHVYFHLYPPSPCKDLIES